MSTLSQVDVDTVRNVFFESDIFGYHDTGLPREVIERPYQYLDGVRNRHGAVALAPDGVLDGIDFAKNFMLNRERPIYVALSFSAVQTVLKNFAIFGQGYDQSFGLLFGRVPPTLDPPEHTAYRALINKAFGRMAVEKMMNEVISPVSDRLIDRIREDGRVDLVPTYSAALPFLAIAKILDLPTDRFPIFATQVRDLMAIGHNPQAGFGAAMMMAEYFKGVVEQRRVSPGEDLISALAVAEIGGEKLTTEEVVSFCKLLTPAGMETTTRTLGNMLVGLLQNREQYERLVRDPSLVSNAVEEGLRWEGPALLMPKLARQDTELEGVRIPAGAYVCAVHGYASHDAGVWDRPHEFDLTRERKPHLAFSGGPHFCAGNQLARREMEIGLASLVKRLPHLALDSSKEAPQILGFAMRSPSHIYADASRTH